MITEVFLGGLASLILAAIVILTLTSSRGNPFAGNDTTRKKHDATDRKPGSDRQIP
jgi:hypothetical protein